jgi:hypothetical protein
MMFAILGKLPIAVFLLFLAIAGRDLVFPASGVCTLTVESAGSGYLPHCDGYDCPDGPPQRDCTVVATYVDAEDETYWLCKCCDNAVPERHCNEAAPEGGCKGILFFGSSGWYTGCTNYDCASTCTELGLPPPGQTDVVCLCTK